MGSDRVLFVLKDGSQAWDVKDYLVRQERCEVVTIEGKDYPGKASPQVHASELLISYFFMIFFYHTKYS